ncbi:unnamed protein product [Penicillium olsonii]|nr:unnamed protein product [Penicillium olsonii]CAG7930441.1 unnamed protein product [Penicillium olsonii]
MINISLRNPYTHDINTWLHTLDLEFLEDTGATAMKIFDSDAFDLEQLSGAALPMQGVSRLTTPSSTVQVQTVVLQANIMGAHGRYLFDNWVNISVCIFPDTVGPQSGSSNRLSGLWLYNMLFVLSMPDNTGVMHMGNDLWYMMRYLPVPDARLAIPPPCPAV